MYVSLAEESNPWKVWQSVISSLCIMPHKRIGNIISYRLNGKSNWDCMNSGKLYEILAYAEYNMQVNIHKSQYHRNQAMPSIS